MGAQVPPPPASTAPNIHPASRHVPPTHVFPRISRFPKSSRLPLAGRNKQKAMACHDAWWGAAVARPPLLQVGSQGARDPYGPLPTGPPSSTHLLALGAWQASVTLGALLGGERC